ncbi:hypothetical protein AAG906_007613 [Vitis piasezkii]
MDCGDGASTVEMVHVIDDEFMTDPILFKKLLEDAKKPLYPSCIKFTKLSALVKLYNVKARYGWSDKSFSNLLQILGDMLPVNNEMPLSVYEVKKTLNALGMEYKKIHACPNDCILYRNELNDASSCPTCGMSRWKLGKDIDVYLAPLVIDLKASWEVKAYDAHQRVLHNKGYFGYHACPICGEETNSHWLKHGNKNSYTDHRRFLPCNHPFRKQKKAFNGEQEFRLPPKELTGDEIFTKVDMIHNSWGKKKKFKQCESFANPTSYWKKKSIFFELEYWKYFYIRHNLDVMHIEKNVCESIIGTVLNILGYCSNFRNLVSLEELKLNGLKSHDYHALMQQLLPIALRSVLPKHVIYAITRLCFFFNALCAKVVDMSRLNDLQQDIVVTLCLLEKYFPPSIFDIMIHLIVHLVKELRLCGPVYMRWMYPFERYMKVLKGYVRNHNRPEGCLVECYIAEEALEFCTKYLSGMDAIGIPSSMKDEWKCGKPLLGGRSEHMKYLKTKYPRQSKRVKWLEDEHVHIFSYWLRKNVSDDISKKELIENELKWLARTKTINKNPVLGDMYFYGIVREIWDLDYNMFNICVFKCDWVDSKNGVKVDEFGFTLVDLSKIGHKSDPFILATQAQQVFYAKMELFDIEGDGNIADNDMDHHPFVNGMPNIKSFDEVEDYDEICMHTNCEGIWIEH